MNPDRDPQTLADAERFDLLEHPERWPDDPVAQARLAEALELHLALLSQGAELAPSLAPRRFRSAGPWLMAAAAAVLALVPTVYALQRIRGLEAEAKSVAHMEEVARRRGEGRLWASFFEQSRDLLARFDQQPPVCRPDHEDRNEERALAQALLRASDQLAAQESPVPGADLARNDLHAWLQELYMEDGCLTAERAEELRRLAKTHDLQSQARKLEALLKGEGS